MRCERAQELFSDYCEGVIPAALKVPFENHLNTCQACATDVAELRATWAILNAEPRIEAPAGFRAMVLQRLDAAKAERNKQTWFQRVSESVRSASSRQRLAWGAAAALLLVFGSFAIPGRYNPAVMMGFGSSAGSQFIASQPSLEGESGSLMARIPLVIAESDGKVLDSGTVQVKVRVIAGPVNLAGSDTITLSGATPGFINLRVVGPVSADPVILEVSRLDGKEPATQQLTIPLPQQ